MNIFKNNTFIVFSALIRKVDEQIGSGVPGAALRVTKNGAKEYKDVTTDAAGRIYLENINPELYVVTEVKVPDGYIMLTGSKEALVEWGKTTTDNLLECGREALGLAANEYVTDIKFQFAEVGEGFHSVTSPTVTVTVLGDLPDGYQFTNRADVGGRTEDEWVYAKDAWTTCIFAPPRGCLPKTGFGG